jgi:cell division transport system ATP-binding protein
MMAHSESSEKVIRLHDAEIRQRDKVVLSHVNLEVFSGEFIYLIGRTGSGKSSLLKALYGELPVTGGEGMCCGYDLRNLRRRHIPPLRRKLGIVFQDFELLTDRNVNDNLRFVLESTGWSDRKAMNSRIESALELVQLEGSGLKKPYEMSGGEQQRVAIARALLNTPHLILADEPTGNLDPQTSLEILNLLLAISKAGTAVLMASHDYATMQKFYSRVLLCENGAIRETTEDLSRFTMHV